MLKAIDSELKSELFSQLLIAGCGMCMLAASCAFVPTRSLTGAEGLLRPGKVMLVGEVHGTKEAPAVFLDMVRTAVGKGMSVLVGFELPSAMGDAIQAYAESSGGRARRLDIVEPRRKLGDGSSSKAMTDVFEELRRIQHYSGRIKVFGFREIKTEQGYADALRTLHLAYPDSVLLALMGNDHARVSVAPDDEGPPAAVLLRSSNVDVTSIDLECSGGSTYLWGERGPGVYQLEKRTDLAAPWRLVPSVTKDYDYVISLGVVHPSLPERGIWLK